MTGQLLMIALARTEQLGKVVQVVVDDEVIDIVSPRTAWELAESGRYIGHGSKRRIRAIQLVPPVLLVVCNSAYTPAPSMAAAPWEACWRNTQAAICQPPIGHDQRTKTKWKAAKPVGSAKQAKPSKSTISKSTISESLQSAQPSLAA